MNDQELQTAAQKLESFLAVQFDGVEAKPTEEGTIRVYFADEKHMTGHGMVPPVLRKKHKVRVSNAPRHLKGDRSLPIIGYHTTWTLTPLS